MNTKKIVSLSISLLMACFGLQVLAAASAPEIEKMPTLEIPSITPETREGGWLRTHKKKIVEGKQKGDLDLLFIGDSITSGIGKRFDSVYGDLSMHNIGYGGDRTEHVLWRLKNGAVEGLSPKVVVLMIGTNNAGQHCPVSTAMGVFSIVKELRERLPSSKILLLGITPSEKWPYRVAGPEVNRIIRSYAGEQYKRILKNKQGRDQKVYYLDMKSAFRNEDGTLRPGRLSRDNLHLSEAGYQAWAKAMEPTIRALLK